MAGLHKIGLAQTGLNIHVFTIQNLHIMHSKRFKLISIQYIHVNTVLIDCNKKGFISMKFDMNLLDYKKMQVKYNALANN